MLRRLGKGETLEVAKHLIKRGFIQIENVALQQYIFTNVDLTVDQRKEYLRDLLRKDPVPIILQALETGRIKFK